MIRKSKLFGLAAIIAAIVVIAIVGVGVTSCSGPEGPMGPEGPQGPSGSSGTGADGADGSDGSDGQDGKDGNPLSVSYTITYDSGEGSAIDPEELIKGGKATEPKHPTREFTHEQIFAEGAGLYRTGAGSGWIFSGWFLDGEPYDFDKAVTADITLKATWTAPGEINTGVIGAVPAEADFFDKALTFVIGNPANYYLVIDDDYTASTTKTATATGITLTIIGLESERTITSATTDGKLFEINNGAVLNLGNHITLKGKTGNSSQPLINITNGTLNMNDGSKITGHTMTANDTGTINVYGTVSRFNMNGGEISGNKSTNTQSTACNIKINLARFTMNSGSITGNTVSAGSCIYVGGSTTTSYFTMNGGTITGNTNTNATVGTGGVYIAQYTNFTMTGGSITNNTATASVTLNDDKRGAGGVFINENLHGVSFTMTGGSITGNTSPMGDVFNYNSPGSPLRLSGSATIGTVTTISGNPGPPSIAMILISAEWTGTVQALNLYDLYTNMSTVPSKFINRPVISAVGSYTLVPADIDKFKQFNFMNTNLVVQDISLQAKGIIKSGTNIGYMTP
jgi:hypothetical protein